MTLNKLKQISLSTDRNKSIISIDGDELLFSYDTLIAIRQSDGTVLLGKSWAYGTTTGNHRISFLGETKAETIKKINDGTYILQDF